MNTFLPQMHAGARGAPLFSPTLSSGALRRHTGEPEQPTMQGKGYLQPYSRGLLLWWPEASQLLILHADGRLGTPLSSDSQGLGEPLAPAADVTLRWQRCARATLLWSAPTGLLLLESDRWQVPLGTELTR